MNTSNLASKMPATASKFMLEVVQRYNITQPLRLAHFLAQIYTNLGILSL